MDWAHDESRLRERLGVALQETRLPEKLTVDEVLTLFAASISDRVRWRRCWRTCSWRKNGGPGWSSCQAVRSSGWPLLARWWPSRRSCFSTSPPQAWTHSRAARSGAVAAYRARGGTVVLTTHYMEEAQRLCDRVAILDRGRLIRLGTPAELIAGLGAEHVVELELETGAGPGALDEATLRALPTVTEVHLSGEGVWALAAVEPERAVPALRTLLQERGQHLLRLGTRKATLEDVFVSLTGRALHDD